MKKRFLILSIVLIYGTLIINSVSAAGLSRTFGGKIIVAKMTGVYTCTGTGPITIKPVGISPATPYATTPTTKAYGSIGTTKWILGKYTVTPLPLCFNDETGIPLTVFPITLYGTSR